MLNYPLKYSATFKSYSFRLQTKPFGYCRFRINTVESALTSQKHYL